MGYLSYDKEYKKIISKIMKNKHFLKIDNCIHHGNSRLDHSLRVSYYSYKISKLLRLNAVETARAGLLHDFFTSDDLSYKIIRCQCEECFNTYDIKCELLK